MHVELSTDNNIKSGAHLREVVESTVQSSLGRFEPRITRVEVHLSDENAHKEQGDDKRCVIEARPAGMQPVAVTHFARSVDEAVTGAAGRMQRLLDSTFGRLHDPKGGTPLSGA